MCQGGFLVVTLVCGNHLKHHVSVMSNLIKLLVFTLVQLQFDVYNNNKN